MSSNQVVVFDIWSSYGYFKRPYTTTTALTFNFIPRSAIEGVIGSILGIDSQDLFLALQNSKIGLGILNEIRKIPFSTMHIHSDFWQRMREYIEFKPSKVKKKNEYAARVNLEIIVNPKYRVYFSDTKLSEKLENYLINHQTKFTPYLGTSSMIANFEYIDTFDYYVQRKKTAEISSIIPFTSKIPNVIIENDKFYAIEQSIPARINKERELLSTYSAIYNPNGQSIKIHDIDEVNSFQYEGKEHNFVFLPP